MRSQDSVSEITDCVSNHHDPSSILVTLCYSVFTEDNYTLSVGGWLNSNDRYLKLGDHGIKTAWLLGQRLELLRGKECPEVKRTLYSEPCCLQGI